MKKTLLLLIVIVGNWTANAQTGLFETVVTTPFNNNINDLTSHLQGWIGVGAEGDCYTPYILRLDSQGKVTWEHRKPFFFGYAYYSTIAEFANGYYIAGNNMIADDFPASEANGFVDRLDLNDSVVNIITDTAYKGGFHKLTTNDSLILVSAAKAHQSNQIPLVVCYDTAGNWLWDYEFANRNIVNIHFMDTLIWVVTDSFTYQINFQGQLIGPQISQYSISSYIYQDTLITLIDNYNDGYWYNRSGVSNGWINFGGSAFQFIDLFSNSIGESFVLMEDTTSNNFALSQLRGSPINRVSLPTKCVRGKCLAVKDTIYAIGGNLLISEANAIVARTISFNELVPQHQSAVEILACSLIVDSIIEISTYAPQNIISITFNGHLIVSAINTGQDTLASVTLQSELLGRFNCSQSYGFSYFDSVNLAPGDTITDTFFFYYANKTLINTNVMDYEVYAFAPNNKLSSSCTVPFKSTPYFVVGIDDPTLAESITLHPNPFSSTVSFTNLPYGSSIGIYNLQGQQLVKAANPEAIDLSHLSQGMYLYRIIGSNGGLIKTGKLVKEL